MIFSVILFILIYFIFESVADFQFILIYSLF